MTTGRRPPFARIVLATAIGALAASYASADIGQPAAVMFKPISFNDAQVRHGRELYDARCAACHGADLSGTASRPLKGRTFMGRWGGGGSSLGALFKYIRDTMPPGGAGSLSPDEISALMALVLSENGLKPSGEVLSSDYRTLQTLRLPYTGDTSGGLSLTATLPPWPQAPNPAATLSPVTDAMLQAPADGDWLSWRRTLDGHGFSPLAEVDRTNVRGLRLAWSFNLAAGPNAATPLVHDGVIFVYSNRDQVDALNAATGDVLWTYKRALPAASSGLPMRVKRNMALYGERLYLATGDNQMVALDVKTGEVAWESATGPASGGPLVVNGTVIEGLFRGERMPQQASVSSEPAAHDPAKVKCVTCGGYGRILGLSATDGKPSWSFNAVPQAGEPGTQSWNDIPFEQRSGASVWTTGYYDPTLDLVFIGTGNTYNTAPLAKPIGKRGTTNDALYTDTTLALKPETGKLAWYYQHQTNDQWDLDWAYERMIIDLPAKGKTTRTVVTAGKMAIIDALNAATGKYLFSLDAGLQNVVTAIDPVTGRKTVNAALVPGEGKTATVCPAQNGAKNWIPGSYDPHSTTLFLPLNAACMVMEPVDPGEMSPLSSGVRWSVAPRPDSDGRYGRVQAFDLVTRKTRWIATQRAPMTSGVLATAGGLVFAGGLDRVFSAYDSQDGKLLWSMKLGDVPTGAPISFAVDGRQYIAVVAGYGTMLSGGYLPLVPEIAVPTTPSSSIYVFELTR
ncbi:MULTISPECIES: PQQ-binding-like beta-propeller repeat protein [unclassified Novosphingobium]|uniref:outer membrane protein assembly factor BamB family protein n=1 Tax=unclassified Novosphingobium TaxID=2644732 RepID=UPI0013570490|nr:MULTISPECIES: PQQ-binding-like beta-propeller repeat protein [unclassified Novosphingobium]